ncbi:Phosphatidylethanolamine-binding protein [Streptomyces sp. Ag109_G2-15]|nr:Phosphatidylethanolamine-binding protein [Streptomyces sp. Ag109_G2-15]
MAAGAGEPVLVKTHDFLDRQGPGKAIPYAGEGPGLGTGVDGRDDLLQARPAPNGFGHVGWGGPMPPPGHGPHRYFFRLYALSEPLPLHDRPGVEDVHRALKGRELASGTLVGTSQR